MPRKAGSRGMVVFSIKDMQKRLLEPEREMVSGLCRGHNWWLFLYENNLKKYQINIFAILISHFVILHRVWVSDFRVYQVIFLSIMHAIRFFRYLKYALTLTAKLT